MDDDVFPSTAMMGTLSDTTGDFDFMDELLLRGCWLETTYGSEFFQPAQSDSLSPFDSLYSLPTSSELKNANSNQVEREISSFPGNLPLVKQQIDNPIGAQSQEQNTINMAEYSGQSESQMGEGSLELGRRWWIAPRENLGSVRERLMQAIQYIKESTKERDILIQIWVPIQREGKNVLTTNDQPFSFDPNSQRLANYRNVSEHYQFPAEEDSKESIGLPGRVFLGKVPEWTPDVRFFSQDEYPRIGHARLCDVRGTLALPVFEQGSRNCLGVIEVVMTTQKTSYRPDLEIVCKALEAVNLRSSEVCSSSKVKVSNDSYYNAIPEILEVLRAVCETHRLPLAQTWVPCIQQGKQGCRHSDETFAYCVSTVDSACYLTDPRILGFHEACSEHHLFRGQGLVGRAFMTNQPCFSTDITALTKTDYPLSHHARIFGLRAAVAIRLRSVHNRVNNYVLEFFLPVECQEAEEQKMLLNSLSIIIQRICRSLRVVTDKELEEETALRIGDVGAPSEGHPKREEIPISELSPPKGSSQEEPSWASDIKVTQRKGKSIPLEEPTEVTTQWDNSKLLSNQGHTVPNYQQHPRDSYSSVEFRFSSAGKIGEKKRIKSEKTISLQVLRQYFAGSLKDAAKSIGVCPTTLKRICRQHGITRWPSRKIKKVGHSLRKLQVVIDSVQGAEGAFQIESFYTNFPDLASPNISGSIPFSKLNDTNHPNVVNKDIISSQAASSKSPSSSCSQSSSSSHSCSSGTQQKPHASIAACNNDTPPSENLTGTLHLPPLLKKSSRVVRNRDGLKVKATYGEDKIRFRMRPNSGFKDLQKKIARRFNIENVSRIDMKYLDDDSEWVLLTCDADLEECMDIYKSFQMHTIKLSVHQVSHPSLSHSSGSSHPL